MMTAIKPTTIEEYINGFPEAVQQMLEEVLATVRKAAPGAEETISYAMPTFKLNKKALVYFAAFQNHIGFYATPTGHKSFVAALSKYKQGKGSVQFPMKDPMPLSLIEKIVKFRVKEVKESSKRQPKKSTAADQ